MYNKNKAVDWFKNWKKQQEKRKPAEQNSSFIEWKNIEEIKIQQEIKEKKIKLAELLFKRNNKHFSITEMSKLNLDIFLTKDQIKFLNGELKNFIFLKK